LTQNGQLEKRTTFFFPGFSHTSCILNKSQKILLINSAGQRAVPFLDRHFYDLFMARLGMILMKRGRIGQASGLMVALCASGMTDIFCGNYAVAMGRSNEIIALAEEKATPVWKVWGTINKGCVWALTREGPGGLDLLVTAFATFRSFGTTYQTWFLLNLAKAYAEARQFDDAWRSCDEAKLAIQTTEEKWCEDVQARLPAAFRLAPSFGLE
jgi:hypothetical protein